jgi:heptosyltransferase-1
MTSARVLLIKMSSLGDVIHNLPVATDLRRHRPDLAIDWVVEEQYVPIVAMHPAVNRILPISLRRWRRKPWSPSIWREFGEFRRRLREERYLGIFDSQGLLKSVFAAHLGAGPVYGFGRRTARDPLSALFYEKTFDFAPQTHKIQRYRGLVAQALGYQPAVEIDYGIVAPENSSTIAEQPYCVLFHSTARAAKLWGEERWTELLRRLNAVGVNCVLPWGSDKERQRSERLARGHLRISVPAGLSVTELASLLASAKAVIGVDTGLMHLAAALSRPVVGIFCDSNPIDACPIGPGPTAWRGHIGAPPSVDAVMDALREVCPALL